MSSIIEGYNYDIFISYRQKDNKGDRWVSEFVEALKTELESTFKEEISVYFDINPHDGLLETHDVDASLKDKLKCLVFIPIISRTYCDPKSFAWEHEFRAFVEQASHDRFGLKVKLPNGNVAGRVLPVRIHDLDAEDIKECESVLGSILRGVEFIYKEPGVDRPLTIKDNEEKNLNKTSYRNQINKAALAIREVIQGMKAAPVPDVKEKLPQREPLENVPKERRVEMQKNLNGSKWFKWLSGLLIIAVVAVAVILVYREIFRKDKADHVKSKGEIAVAVMPFQNMTSDTTWNIWQDGIQEILINTLSTSEELNIRQVETVKSLIQGKGLTNYASITPSVAGKISQKLDADIFVSGKIIQSGQTLRVYAQITESKSHEIFKSFQIDGNSRDILLIIDSLSYMVKDFLILSKLRKESSPIFQLHSSVTTNSPEAYRYYLCGQNAYDEGNLGAATEWCLKALELDSNFTSAAYMIPYTYSFRGLYEDAKKWCLKLYAKREQLTVAYKLKADLNYAYYFETPYEEIECDKQLIKIDDQSPYNYASLGFDYMRLMQYDKAINAYEKVLEIYTKWGVKPEFDYYYTLLGYAYHKTDQYKKEAKLYRKAQKYFPDDVALLANWIVLSISLGDDIKANRLIEKYISSAKDSKASDADIAAGLANLYSMAEMPDESEEYLRKALSLEPENPLRMNNLAWFLIDKDRNVEEGMELVDKALALSPNDYSIIDTKGRGLYKQGKYKEALDLLEKAWRLKPVYDHEVFLHLEAARKAVAGQKNN
jgi:tetratricopeptide (TPR) repeat protein